MSTRNKKRNNNNNNNNPNNVSTLNKISDSVKPYESCIHERPSRSQKRERDLLYLDNDDDDDSDSNNDSVEEIVSNENSLQKEIESTTSTTSTSTIDNSSSSKSSNDSINKDKTDKTESNSNNNDNDANNNDNGNNKRTLTEDKDQTPPKKKTKVVKPLFKPLETPGPDGKLYEGPVPTLPEILDTLLSHFIPDPYSSEFESFEGMLVPMEEAWWYYTDFYYEAYNDEENVPKLGFRSFVHKMFDLCPSLADLKDSINNFSDIDEIVSAYSKYKSSIPCAGIIILDSSLKQVLLVKGAWKGAKWGFPKGKLKPSENPLDGALREVKEEIGVEIRTLIDPSFKVTKICGGKNVSMFLACNVPWSGSYAPKVRNEIACIEWHSIANIPSNKMSYSNVLPFLTSLEKWIAAESKKRSKKANPPSNNHLSSSSSSRKDAKKRSSPSSSPTHSPAATIHIPPLPNENDRLNGNNAIPYNDGYHNGNVYNDGYQNNQNIQNNPQQYQPYDANYNGYNNVNDLNPYGNGMNNQNPPYDIYNQQQNNPNIPPNNQQFYQDIYQPQHPPPPPPQYYPNPQYANQPEFQPQPQYMNPNPVQYYPPEYHQDYQNIPQNYSNAPPNNPQPIPPMNPQYPQQEAPAPPLPPPSPLPPPPPPAGPPFQQEQYQGYQQYNNVPITNTAMAASVNRKLNERRRYAQYNQQFGDNQMQQQGGRLPSFLL